MKNKIISFIITLIAMFLLRNYITARAQLVTFILFVLTIYFIERFLETGKKRYVIGLVIIPIIIANVHLAVFPFYFILYLPYIGEYIIYKIINYEFSLQKLRAKKLKKKLQKDDSNESLKQKLEITENKCYEINKKKEKREKNAYKVIIKPSKYILPLIIIMLVCILTGLLTPLKEVPYTYLVKTMQGNTTQSISEHLPLTLIQNKEFMILLAVYVLILMFTDTKIRLSDLFLIAGLVLLAFMTRRQESMVIILGSFVLNRLISSLLNKYNKEYILEVEKIIARPLVTILTIILIVLFAIFLYEPKIDDPYVLEASYPVQASKWILENLDINTMKLYNEYNYGSYLLFKGIPVFIDSRADLYAPEFNKTKDIFSDFINIFSINFRNMQSKLDEYGFTHFIMQKNSKLNIYMELKPRIYKEIYSDNNFIIYERI